MTRLGAILTGLLLFGAAISVAQSGSESVARQIAVTIDDLPTASVLGYEPAAAEKITRDLVDALKRHGVPAIGFVNEAKLFSNGQLDPRRVALLQAWIDAELELGNHTFSHPDLHSTPIDAFEREVLKGEKITRDLMRKAGRELKYFRHPFLHTGRSEDIRNRLAKFLADHDYTVAPVTVDNYDYVFAAAYDRARAAGDISLQKKVAAGYVEYMQAVVEYYEGQSTAIVGREIAQTLLLHANALNADTFGRLAVWLEARRYRFVSLERALQDPAYAMADAYYGPAGITWLHRWALTQGKGGPILAGEPTVPEWIERASRLR